LALPGAAARLLPFPAASRALRGAAAMALLSIAAPDVQRPNQIPSGVSQKGSSNPTKTPNVTEASIGVRALLKSQSLTASRPSRSLHTSGRSPSVMLPTKRPSTTEASIAVSERSQSTSPSAQMNGSPATRS
jgi:hypothetical protein